MTVRIDTGRYCAGSLFPPFLCIALTLALFNASGNVFTLYDKLMRSRRSSLITGVASLMSLADSSSYPVATLGFILLIRYSTLWLVSSAKTNSPFL